MITNNSIFPDLRDSISDYRGIQLLEKLKLVSKSSTGVYCILPLGALIVKRLEDVIKNKFYELGCYEVRFPTLMTEKSWKKSKRWESFDSLLKIQDRLYKNLCLNPTHEETAVETINNILQSYKDLPITLYCINKVYRDEIRPKYGLLRTKEFIMADAYSFTIDYDSFLCDYKRLVEIHRSIFNELGLNCIEATADNGDIGGSTSIEFIYPDYLGESILLGCEKCNHWTTKVGGLQYQKCEICGEINLIQKKGIELAHIFQLNQIYTKKMSVRFLNAANKLEHPFTNCSGIGVTRLLQVLVEQSFIKNGKITPSNISPFDVSIYHDASEENHIYQRGKSLYNKLSTLGYRALLDTRKIPERPKLKLADILNCRLNINLIKDSYKVRFDNQEIEIEESDIIIYIQKILSE